LRPNHDCVFAKDVSLTNCFQDLPMYSFITTWAEAGLVWGPFHPFMPLAAMLTLHTALFARRVARDVHGIPFDSTPGNVIYSLIGAGVFLSFIMACLHAMTLPGVPIWLRVLLVHRLQSQHRSLELNYCRPGSGEEKFLEEKANNKEVYTFASRLSCQ
jgi:hypothetical protein